MGGGTPLASARRSIYKQTDRHKTADAKKRQVKVPTTHEPFNKDQQTQVYKNDQQQKKTHVLLKLYTEPFGCYPT